MRFVKIITVLISVVVIFGLLLGTCYIGFSNFSFNTDKRDFLSETVFNVVLGNEDTEIYPNKIDDIYYLFLPSFAEELYLDIDYDELIIDGKAYGDGDYVNIDFENKVYKVICKQNSDEKFSANLYFCKSGNIGTAFIETATGTLAAIEADKDYKEGGKLILYDKNGGLDFEDDLAYIKGRGNGSWDCEKKSYNFSVSKDVNLLKIGNSSKWNLLANYGDLSSIRNKFIYDFSEEIGLEFASKSDFVDLYVNGEYRGLYQLCQDVDNILPKTENGYFFQMEIPDRMKHTNSEFVSSLNQNLICINPNKVTSDFKAKINEFESFISSDFKLKDLSDYVDIDSFVRKYLIEEFFLNYDAFATSAYFYTKGDIKSTPIYAGPAWDYDGSSGNDNKVSAENAFIANSASRNNYTKKPWFNLLYNNPEFYSKICEEYKNNFSVKIKEALQSTILDLDNKLLKAKKSNDIRWQKNCEGETEKFSNFIERRIEFCDRVWSNNEKINCVTFISNTGYPNENITFGYFEGEFCSLSDYPFSENALIKNFEWYYDKELTKPCEDKFIPNENITLYAKHIYPDFQLGSKETSVDFSNVFYAVIVVSFIVFGASLLLYYFLHIKRSDVK